MSREKEGAAPEPQEVAAEVIDGEAGGLSVSMLPGSIAANFDALDARVDVILAQYDGWEPSADSEADVRQCAGERKYLNGLAKQIDERRKAVKQGYLRPLEAFEARANAARDRIRGAAARLQDVEKQADEARKASKEAELRAHYEELAPLLADVVPYGRVADPKWLNKSPGVVKCKEELEARVQKVAADWDALKALDLGGFFEQAELRFFDTLDLGGAVAWANKLADDKRRLDAMKAEQERFRAEQQPAEPAPAPEPAPMRAMEPMPAPMPMPQPAPIPVPAERDAARKLTGELEGLAPSAQQAILGFVRLAKSGARGAGSPCLMVIDAATPEQMRAIGRLCGLLGVTGTFRAGTLEQVWRRMHGPEEEAVYDA